MCKYIAPACRRVHCFDLDLYSAHVSCVQLPPPSASTYASSTPQYRSNPECADLYIGPHPIRLTDRSAH